MKDIRFIVLIWMLSLLGCSKISDESFSLVCNGTEVIESGEPVIDSRESKPITKTYNFKNKKLDGYDCHTWTNEKILCSKNSDPSDKNHYYHETINIDRVSGVVGSGYTQNNRYPNQKSEIIFVERFEGKCERSKQNKF